MKNNQDQHHHFHSIILSFFLLILLSAYSNASPVIIANGGTVFESNEQMFEKLAGFLNELQNAYKEDRNPKINSSFVTAELERKILTLWNRIQFYSPDLDVDQFQTGKLDNNRYEIRNIPIKLHDASENVLDEYLVIVTNSKRIIEDFRLGLNPNITNKIQSESGNEDLEAVNKVIRTIENLKTAYHFRSANQIQKIFSGRPLVQVSGGSPYGDIGGAENSRNLQLMKSDDVMDAVVTDLNNSDWIHVNFEQIQITKHPVRDKIYGMSSIQHYKSSSKQVSGYVLYVLDFFNTSVDHRNPTLIMHSWQSLESTTEDDILDMSDVEIF